MADDLQRLLSYIAHQYTGRARTKELERDANAEEPADALVASERRTVEEEERRAAALEPAFRDGLMRAIASRRAGGNAISLDDRVPEENRMADALVHFLVSAGLAESTTRESEPMHYIYTIQVDWPGLMQVASAANVNLDTLLG